MLVPTLHFRIARETMLKSAGVPSSRASSTVINTCKLMPFPPDIAHSRIVHNSARANETPKPTQPFRRSSICKSPPALREIPQGKTDRAILGVPSSGNTDFEAAGHAQSKAAPVQSLSVNHLFGHQNKAIKSMSSPQTSSGTGVDVPSSAGAKLRLASASSSSSSNHINERPLRSRLGYSRWPFSVQPLLGRYIVDKQPGTTSTAKFRLMVSGMDAVMHRKSI